MTRHITLAALFCSHALAAQTTWNVQVGGSTAGGPLPFYTPQTLTIEVGDIVQWNNVSGTHNVNGSTALYPGNPEGFDSGEAASDAWTFDHTFTIAGVYNYRCTQDGHSATQNGTITVVNTTSVQEPDEAAAVTLHPVPATDVLMIDLGNLDIRTADIISMDGKRVVTHSVNGSSRVELPLHGLATGQYFVRLVDASGWVIVRPFRKE